MSRNNLILWIIILIAGAGLLISANIFRDTNPGSIVGTSIEPTSTPEPQTTPRPSPKPSPSFPIATCQLSGSVKFINENLYETIGAKIAYQNVDDAIRQIYWKSNPG